MPCKWTPAETYETEENGALTGIWNHHCVCLVHGSSDGCWECIVIEIENILSRIMTCVFASITSVCKSKGCKQRYGLEVWKAWRLRANVWTSSLRMVSERDRHQHLPSVDRHPWQGRVQDKERGGMGNHQRHIGRITWTDQVQYSTALKSPPPTPHPTPQVLVYSNPLKKNHLLKRSCLACTACSFFCASQNQSTSY